MSGKVYTDAELVYSAIARCSCGAGLAHPRELTSDNRYWDCSDILTGRALSIGEIGAKEHTSPLPFAFWKVKSEEQPSAYGHTTRPGRKD